MSLPPHALGDSHNFGRRVSMRDGWVHKPRTLLWEWLLLSVESPLRQLLNTVAADDPLGPDAFSFLASLRFPKPLAPHGGEVERVTLLPLQVRGAEDRRSLARVVGRAIALFSWLGVADLHWENLVLGMDGQGHTVFSPLDIEIILADLSLPTETKLLPDADPEYAAICRHACGVRRVLPFLGKPVNPTDLVAMAAAYRRTLALLDRHARAIADTFLSVPGLQDTPIRVCLRGTEEYVRAGEHSLWPPLLDAESEQLSRGDIPYFFRLYGRPGIHYYANETLSDLRRLPSEGDVPQLDPMLSLSHAIKGPSRKKLREEGLFAVIAAFDHRSFKGRIEADGLSVLFSASTVVVTLASGREMETQRNLRALVQSVYSPCSCGEVNEVFVPQTTVCNAPSTPSPVHKSPRRGRSRGRA